MLLIVSQLSTMSRIHCYNPKQSQVVLESFVAIFAINNKAKVLYQNKALPSGIPVSGPAKLDAGRRVLPLFIKQAIKHRRQGSETRLTLGVA